MASDGAGGVSCVGCDVGCGIGCDIGCDIDCDTGCITDCATDCDAAAGMGLEETGVTLGDDTLE